MAEFELSEGTDRVRGTGSNDTITGGPGTLSSGDVIRGGGGNDTLTADVEQNGVQDPRIRGVENIFVDTGGLAFDIGRIDGAKRIVSDTASTTFQGITSGDLGIRFGARDIGSGQVQLSFADGALGSGASIKLEAISSNVTFLSPKNEDNRAISEIDLRLRGDQDGPAIDGDVQVDLSSFTRLETLVLRGDATSKVVVDSTELTEIDGTKTSGGFEITSDVDTDQTVLGGSGADDVKTGAGDDTFEMGRGADVVNAGAGANVARLNQGDDTYTGEAGVDEVRGGDGADDIKTGGAADIIMGGNGNDTISGEGGADDIYGGAGADEIDGGNNGDTIRDGKGDDIVRAGGGEDTLIAGKGRDTLDGGAGADVFDFVTNTGLGNDTVGDATKFAIGTDTAQLLVGGTRYDVSTQEEWRTLEDEQGDAVTVDSGGQIIEVDIDNGGVVTFNVDDADFF